MRPGRPSHPPTPSPGRPSPRDPPRAGRPAARLTLLPLPPIPSPPFHPRLLPAGQDPARVLAGNPDLVLSLQRGTAALGPGAEF
jgi:hypothetical protein